MQPMWHASLVVLSLALPALGLAAPAVRPIQLKGSFGAMTVRVPTGGGAHPLVLLQHGWLVHAKQYDFLAEHLVARGFAVASLEQPDNTDLRPSVWIGHAQKALDHLEAENAAPGARLRGKLDLARVAAVGHSLGGATVLGLAATDARIKVAVAAAPATHARFRAELLGYAERISVPVLMLGGGVDFIAPPSLFARPVAARCRSCRVEEQPLANHLNFSSPGLTLSVPTPFGMLPLTMDGDRQRAWLAQRTTAWLDQALGSPGASR